MAVADEAALKIRKASEDLAKMICDEAVSLPHAGQLIGVALNVIQIDTRVTVLTPQFQERIRRIQQTQAELAALDANASLVDQLAELGIDHEPIFADRMDDP